MTVTYVEVHGSFGEKSPLLPLDRTRDGLASYCEARWPVGRRKSVAREWDMSADEARSVCEGSASQMTLDKVWRHKRGGWAVLLPVMGAVIGQPIHEFFRQQARAAAEEERRALEQDKLARTAYRRLLAGPDSSSATRVSAEAAREARGFTGTLGAEAPRRVAD